MDDLISEFIVEAKESIEVVDGELVRLEQNPNDAEILGNIFRLVHTVKGTCGFLGLPRLESVAHAGENVLGKFRDGEVEVDADAVSIIFESLDCITSLIDYLDENGEEQEGNDADLIARLNSFADGNKGVVSDDDSSGSSDGDIVVGSESGMSADELQALEDAFNNAEIDPDIAESMGIDAEAEAETVEEVVEEVIEEQVEATKPAKKADKKADSAAPAASANQSIRVNIDVLENLMSMVGELVLNRNQLAQVIRHKNDEDFKVPLQQLSLITSELQEGVMKTRMQPIGNAWSKFPRLIRDLSIDLDKKIDLKMEGADTELDRQMLEKIKDPLTHMVRNSCDHGLETKAERAASGKPEVGSVVLSAYHEGGHVIVKLVDDGKGVNIEKVSEKIIENGLATEDELAELSEHQIAQYIFKAGFSTAAVVTSVSGRGVGMDVVRTNIESIGGIVELESVTGQGSTFLIKIPLTLAIVSALIVEVEGEKFGIPQINVVELVRTGAALEHQIEVLNNSPVLRLRDKLLPLIPLVDVLQLEPNDDIPQDDEPSDIDDICSDEIAVESSENSENADENSDGEDRIIEEMVKTIENCNDSDDDEADSDSDYNLEDDDEINNDNKYIVVCRIGANDFGVIVDRVYDTEEIVVKPVSECLKHIPVYSGNTVLGDGSVIMILDPNGIARSIGKGLNAVGDDEEEEVEPNHDVSFLLFSNGDGTPKAVPLELVSRLEELEVKSVEYSDGEPVVQYRGNLMRLTTIDGKKIPDDGLFEVIVFVYDGHAVGLVVEEIIDIAATEPAIKVSSDNKEYLGSLVIEEKTTDIVDIGHLLSKTLNITTNIEGIELDEQEGISILFVEDSMFFRNLTVPFLSAIGYRVQAVASASDALAILAQSKFDLVVTDIEMPDMDGFGLAREIRANPSISSMPIIAFTSTMNADFDEKMKESGIDNAALKTEREKLIIAIDGCVNKTAEKV